MSVKTENHFCKNCGKEFNAKVSEINRGGGKFCSKECSIKYHCGKNHHRWVKKVECICLQCGKVFEEYSSIIKKGGGKFCSQECSQIYRRRERSSNWKGGKIKCICQWCRTEFEESVCHIKRGQGKFCSRECASEARKVKKVRCICKQCGKEFFVNPSAVKYGHGKFCSPECANEAQKGKSRPDISGENCHLYKHGKSYEPYSPTFFHTSYRSNLINHFNQRCAECGKHVKRNYIKVNGEMKQVGLNLHHVFPLEKGELITIPLCHSCHAKIVASNEDIYERKYAEMIISDHSYWQALENEDIRTSMNSVNLLVEHAQNMWIRKQSDTNKIFNIEFIVEEGNEEVID